MNTFEGRRLLIVSRFTHLVARSNCSYKRNTKILNDIAAITNVTIKNSRIKLFREIFETELVYNSKGLGFDNWQQYVSNKLCPMKGLIQRQAFHWNHLSPIYFCVILRNSSYLTIQKISKPFHLDDMLMILFYYFHLKHTSTVSYTTWTHSKTLLGLQ